MNRVDLLLLSDPPGVDYPMRAVGCKTLAAQRVPEIWDEVLAPTPRNTWEDYLDRVVQALAAQDADGS
jgi:hypothetical protein